MLAVGNDSQVAQLADMQKKGELGCFGLTERFAGVSSGMVVETTATWDAPSDSFILHTPSDKAAKVRCA